MDRRIILKCILHKEFEYLDLIQLVIIHISYNFNTNLYAHKPKVDLYRFSWCIKYEVYMNRFCLQQSSESGMIHLPLKA